MKNSYLDLLPGTLCMKFRFGKGIVLHDSEQADQCISSTLTHCNGQNI